MYNFLYVYIYVYMYIVPTRNLHIPTLTYIYIHNYTCTYEHRMLVYQVSVLYINIQLQYILIFRMYMYMCICTCNLLGICNLLYSTSYYQNYSHILTNIYTPITNKLLIYQLFVIYFNILLENINNKSAGAHNPSLVRVLYIGN